MKNGKQEFLNSLDLIDQEIEAYIPCILEGLWELGSMPNYIISLIKRNIDPKNIHTITDFGCGKGAVLIRLASEFEFSGLGIDIVPEFIASAQKYAKEYYVADSIKFVVGDIREMISNRQKQDIVIYGYDSGVLGDVKEALLQLGKCLSTSGWIILEVAYTPDDQEQIEDLPSERDVNRLIESSGFHKVDKIIWDRREIKRVNQSNNQKIQHQIAALIKAHPDKARLFRQYMDHQLEECAAMENNMICSTWLLQKS